MTTPRAHDDLEAILSQVAVDDGASTHTVASDFDTTFTWNYSKGERPALDKLYETSGYMDYDAAGNLAPQFVPAATRSVLAEVRLGY